MIALHQQDILCNSRVNFVPEILLFGKDVKMFLNMYVEK